MKSKLNQKSNSHSILNPLKLTLKKKKLIWILKEKSILNVHRRNHKLSLFQHIFFSRLIWFERFLLILFLFAVFGIDEICVRMMIYINTRTVRAASFLERSRQHFLVLSLVWVSINLLKTKSLFVGLFVRSFYYFSLDIDIWNGSKTRKWREQFSPFFHLQKMSFILYFTQK